ncbi:hypothetical protein V8E55_007806 [Tylopilus felleus]
MTGWVLPFHSLFSIAALCLRKRIVASTYVRALARLSCNGVTRHFDLQRSSQTMSLLSGLSNCWGITYMADTPPLTNITVTHLVTL